ncbi:MAG TPA: DegV family protein [Roseiflexaceae bacterium]|nr:DegV family protein [Roseiflexaceae bacterium]
MAVELSLETPVATTGRAPKPAARRQVVVAIDACCELEPALAQRLGLLVLPHHARVDGQAIELDAGRTLHHSCWPTPPQRVQPEPHTVGALAPRYEEVLREGMSVLALHWPERLDPAARVALAARSILLAAPPRGADGARVAVYELAAVGHGFSFLVEVAARGAAAGMTLGQIAMLLDRAQPTVRGCYLTSRGDPAPALRGPEHSPLTTRFAHEALWALDAGDGRLVCQARGWKLARGLFGPDGPLAGQSPSRVTASSPRLLEQLNAGRTVAGLPPLEAEPGGTGLRAVFPRGCVELAFLPDTARIAAISDVIRRIDRPAPAPVRGVRQRGGL